MKEYKVAISNLVYEDLESIGNFIISNNTKRAANKYLKSLYEDIETLKHTANSLPYSEWDVIKRIHPKAKRLLSKNKHWNIVFHISGDYVIVDRIIASSIIR